jgi:hypothetical protein
MFNIITGNIISSFINLFQLINIVPHWAVFEGILELLNWPKMLLRHRVDSDPRSQIEKLRFQFNKTELSWYYLDALNCKSCLSLLYCPLNFSLFSDWILCMMQVKRARIEDDDVICIEEASYSLLSFSLLFLHSRLLVGLRWERSGCQWCASVGC